MPVIGYLGGSSPASRGHLLTAFWRGIRESGYVEGENVTIDYRWAQDQYNRLPDLAADLSRRNRQALAPPPSTLCRSSGGSILYVIRRCPKGSLLSRRHLLLANRLNFL